LTLVRNPDKSCGMFHESFRSLAVALLCITSGVALARDISSITQYPVTGKTAGDVYADIKAHAPRVASNATFAFTMIATKTDKREKVAAKSCRYSSVKTSAIYNFVIPRHSNAEALPAKTRLKWDNFVTYLKIHEQGHRQIWQTCLANFDKAALDLSASTCKALDLAREQLLTSIKRSCLQQDEAYDVQFRRAVLREPFVAEALRAPQP
jgi:predicted secreted Zn-dependent protease